MSWTRKVGIIDNISEVAFLGPDISNGYYHKTFVCFKFLQTSAHKGFSEARVNTINETLP